MIEASKRLHPWRDLVIEAAREQAELTDRLDGPVEVLLEFRIPSPNKPIHILPISRRAGDIDKLSRAVLDGITIGGIIGDDSQVVKLHATKEYAPDYPGVIIGIREAGQ
jgi:Holliday junction resolvase RusA-like endonuclease